MVRRAAHPLPLGSPRRRAPRHMPGARAGAPPGRRAAMTHPGPRVWRAAGPLTEPDDSPQSESCPSQQSRSLRRGPGCGAPAVLSASFRRCALPAGACPASGRERASGATQPPRAHAPVPHCRRCCHRRGRRSQRPQPPSSLFSQPSSSLFAKPSSPLFSQPPSSPPPAPQLTPPTPPWSSSALRPTT